MEALDTTLYEEGTQVPLNPHTTSSQVSHKDTTVKKALEETVNFTPQNLTPGQQTQARENINALEDEAGVIDGEHIATGAVTTDKIADKAVVKGKLSEDLQEVLDNAGTKAIRINFGDVEAAKKAIADYNADPNKTVVLVNYAGIRIPAIVSDTYNPVIVAYLPEGINVHKLLFQGDAWSETVIYGDNVRYNNQTLTAAQKAQARKNIDVDYLTEDEVANLWDTTK